MSNATRELGQDERPPCAKRWRARAVHERLAENAPMLHLARKQGLQVAISSGEAEAFVRLPPRNLRSLAREAMAEQVGLIDHAHKSHWLALRGLWLE